MLRPHFMAALAPLRSQRDSAECCQKGKTSPAPLLNQEESIRVITHQVGSGKNLLPTDSLQLPASFCPRASPDGRRQQLIPARRATAPPACMTTACPLPVGLAAAHRQPAGPETAHHPRAARAPTPAAAHPPHAQLLSPTHRSGRSSSSTRQPTAHAPAPGVCSSSATTRSRTRAADTHPMPVGVMATLCF